MEGINILAEEEEEEEEAFEDFFDYEREEAAPLLVDSDDDEEEEEDEEAANNAKVNALNQQVMADSTREEYQGRLRHFVDYLKRTDPDIVIDDDSFDVQRLHIKQFQLFLLYKQEHDHVSYNTLVNYRIALSYAFQRVKLEMPSTWGKKLKTSYRNLRRIEAGEIQSGKRTGSQGGKRAMPHKLFVWLCEYYIRVGNIFAWAYLTLAWNSMCRSNNVSDIHLAHWTVLEDALGLRIPKSKGDQAGRRAHLYWHIFANPLDVRQCPVTALATLLLLDDVRSVDRLFMGGHQDQRFARDMNGALETPGGKAKMVEVACPPGTISPHSARKGSATFASNGASFVAISLRAGWSMGEVKDRYFQQDQAADAILGRVLAGLDSSSASFAVLPPHFKPDTVDDATLLRCFPAYHSRRDFLGILRFALPSLVYHHAQLLEWLPKRHKLHGCSLFSNPMLRQTLASHIVSGVDSPYMKATGLPPHIALLRQNNQMMGKIDGLGDSILQQNNQMMHQIGGLGNAIVDQIFQRLGGGGTANNALPPPPAAAPAVFLDDGNDDDRMMIVPVEGVIKAFPINFELPAQVSSLTAWRLLLRGNGQTPPFRLLNPKDFKGNRTLCKRISDWLFIYNLFASKLGGLDEVTLARLADDDSEQELTDLFLRAWGMFDFNSVQKNKAIKTRPEQWTFGTMVNRMRGLTAKAKAVATEAALEETSDILTKNMLQRPQRRAPLVEQKGQHQEVVIVTKPRLLPQKGKSTFLTLEDAEEEEENKTPTGTRKADYSKFFSDI